MFHFTHLFHVLSAALLALAATACDKSPTPAASGVELAPQNPAVVSVAFALGGKGDLSYNDAADKGVKRLQQSGITVRQYEPPTLDDYAKGLELLAAAKPKIIFCVGFLYDDPVLRSAAKFPDTLFVVLDGAAAAAPNVASIKFDAREGSVLAGAVAGRITKTKRIAFIGGMDIPIINEFRDGFTRGIKMASPDTIVQSYYVGSGGGAFTDPVKGREVALTAIGRGADVVYHAAGSSGNGVIKAAKERGISAIGVDVDQSHLAPGVVVTSMTKNFDVAMLKVIEQVRAGTPVGGKSLVMGVEEGAVSLTPVTGAFAAAATDAVAQATQLIKAERQRR